MKHLVLTVLLVFAFAINLHAVAPLIGDVADQNIAQGGATGTLNFVVGDTETTFTALTVAAVASNSALLPTIALGGTNAQRTINITAANGLTGTATVTLTVTDGEALSASSSFNVTVTPSNSKPTLTALQGYQIASPGQTPSSVTFTVGDTETAAGSLFVTATSSNTSLVPNANITLGGSGASRTVQITPVSGQKGTAVIKLRVTDPLGASTVGEFIFSVFDAASANNGFKQPRGIYLLDSTAGSLISGVRMRDGNIRNLPFVDGYVLRTEWDTLEPTNGVFDFTIITNIFSKLPAGQKLSLLLGTGVLPSWLNTAPGVVTYTAGSPATTQPVPWNPAAQERFRLLLVALGNHLVDGVPLRNHPRLAAVDLWIPGLKSGIRPLTGVQIRDIPGYTRTLFEGGVLTHLANVTDNFPNVPAMIGFWTYTDTTASPVAWESLRQAILAQHNGTTRPRVGFWMENLAANRAAADAEPWTGLPNHSFTAALFDSQDQTYVGYQVLGSWSRPFSADHVDNNLNGSPEDGMDYGFNDFQCRYYEHYQADVDFSGYTAEFQRWHDFLAALPGPPVTVTFGSSQGGTSLSAAHGSSLNITLSASGGTPPYAWAIIGGALPSGINLNSSGLLSGSSTQTGSHSITVQVTDATGGSATQSYTLVIEAPPSAPQWTANATRNSDGTVTLGWATAPDAWYQIEVSDDLTRWTKLGSSVQATTTAMNWTDNGSQTGTHPTSASRRFYRVRNWGTFNINFTGNNFTYSDAQRTVTGIFIKPAGAGPFPALIINHGTSGTAGGFGLQRANEMSPWGLACIAANLTHMAGATQDNTTWGYSPENLARIRACQAVLATRSDVNVNRLALWGHSRGAFAAIGAASDFGSELKALGFTAGGIHETADLSEPSAAEASHITAPTIMFHGSTDTIVPPADSLLLQTLLNTQGVTNTRIFYDTTGITPANNAHNIQNTTFYTAPTTGILAQWRAWLITHGVLP